MANVYAFPPVPVRAYAWIPEQPISRSLGYSGTDKTSAYQRERRVVGMTVNGLNASGTAQGYVLAFRRLLRGGLNYARIRSMTQQWFNPMGELRDDRGERVLEWTDSGRTLDWKEGSAPLIWYDGLSLAASPIMDGPWHAVRVTGLPPKRLVALPDELVTVGSASARVLKHEFSDADGVALIRITNALPAGEVIIGNSETAVFRHVDALPRAMVPLAANFTYDFNFIEVFAEEVDGGFEDLDPWR